MQAPSCRRRIGRAVRARPWTTGDSSAVSVTTYTDFVHPDPRVRAASVEELVDHAQVAAALGAGVLRAFLGERADDASMAALAGSCADGLLAAAAGSAGSGVTIAIEPHDDFLASAVIASLLERIGGPGHRRHLGCRQHLVAWASAGARASTCCDPGCATSRSRTARGCCPTGS